MQKSQGPSLNAALFCVAFLIVSMSLSVLWLDIPIHITLLASMSVTIMVAMFYGEKWENIAHYIEEGGRIAILPTLVMMIIGAVIGSWIASGTVPVIIYWGLKLISPQMFLVTGCLVCALTSISCGSSWSTAGTVGIALMGIGGGLGVNPAMTAGAVISGAYLGDKMSPMSDTTNLAPAVAESELFDHIRSMMYTSIPAFLITLAFYFFLGKQFTEHSVNLENISQTMQTIENTYNMNPVVFIPPVLVILLAIKKFPALPTLILACASAALIAIFLQHSSVTSITNNMMYGYVSKTGVAEIDKLLSRGGLQSMLWTAALGILGMIYGKIFEGTGILEVFMKSLQRFTTSLFGLVTTTLAATFFLNAATASQTLSIVVGGRMFISEYRKKDLLPQTLSRTLEDGATLFSPLVPWSLCGVFMSGTLGVSTWLYIPYASFCWLCPLIAMVYAATGKFFWKTGEIPSKMVYNAKSQSI